MSNADSRDSRRRPLRILVDYVSEEGVHCAYATNLSTNGLFLESDAPLSRGSTLKLRFRLPGGENLHEIEGRVARTQEPKDGSISPPGMGVQFTDSDAKEKLGRELEDSSAPA